MTKQRRAEQKSRSEVRGLRINQKRMKEKKEKRMKSQHTRLSYFYINASFNMVWQ